VAQDKKDMIRVLLTTTSFQDTPGPHHERLAQTGYDIVRQRGPLREAELIAQVGEIDALLCGDDEISAAVMEQAQPRLRVISKYGIGLDKIDLGAAAARQLPVLFTPGVNHTTVAEHTMALMLAVARHLVFSVEETRAGRWTRLIGHELAGKKLGLIGLGRIGQEVARRARAFGLHVHAYGSFWPEDFAREHEIERAASLTELITCSDIISLHTKLEARTHHLLGAEELRACRPGTWLINSSRAELVDTAALLPLLDTGHIAAYATDVMDREPPEPDHPLLRHPRALITPHIGSRTYESVPRQALLAVENLIHFLEGTGTYHQV
jgi:D-3-phosphoglycerate dehydrogenase / 2-oxoglutarate reductase